MLKILRRKPKESMTPGQRYKHDLAILFACGMMATLGVCLAVVAVTSAIEEGLPTVADRVFLVSIVIVCIVLTYVGLRTAARLTRSLMEHAPVDRELEAETSSAPLLHTGEVRYSDILDPMPPIDYAVLRYAGRPQRHLLWKIGKLVACSACSGFCLMSAGLLSPTIVSALFAGEGIPQSFWIIYGSLWGGGWAFAFMVYLSARNIARHVKVLVRLNLDRTDTFAPIGIRRNG